MIDKCIIFSGTPCAIGRVPPVPGETVKQHEERLRAYAKKKGRRGTIVDASSLPTDRTFRNAWKKSGEGVVVDLPAARTLHMNHLRRLRDKKLGKLDVEYMRASEDGDSDRMAEIKQQKDWLRDMPDNYALSDAQTPEALKQKIPALLEGEAV